MNSKFASALSFLFLNNMFRRTSSLAFSAKSNERIKVAILGSGMSGCSAAATLLGSSSSKSFDVSIYEGGRGVGGRMSTRRIKDESGKPLYQFDHGCQYISAPKTDSFRNELENWKEEGWVQPWKGTFGTISASPESSTTSEIELSTEPSLNAKEKYVGFPAMNTICEKLLETKSDKSTINIFTGTQARAVAVQSKKNGCESPWQLYHKDKLLGTYDWLVVTDRNSAQELRPDLIDANVDDFRQLNKYIESVKSCTTMIAFEKPLPLPFDGLTFNYNSNKETMRNEFNTLGWAARDSSKPGRRESDDSPECWVLQSNPEEAARLLKSDELQGATLAQIREKIREQMVNDFICCIPTLMTKSGLQKTSITPQIVDSMGHRWGAAFPSFLDEKVYKEIECQVFPKKKIVACGDYFGKYSARVEGAYLSGRAAANEILKCTG